MEKLINAKNVTRIVAVTLIASSVYVIAGLITAPRAIPDPELTGRVKYDYFVLLLQCAAGMAALRLPEFLTRKTKKHVPGTLVIIYAFFVFGGIVCGNILYFYNIVPHWDTILHTTSGALLCALGFSIVVSFSNAKSAPLTIAPLFTVLFAFCFAAAVGVFWEIIELIMDLTLGINAQRYATMSGEPLVGQAALMDTMKDFVFNTVGAAAYAVYGFKSIKRNDTLIKSLAWKRVEE